MTGLAPVRFSGQPLDRADHLRADPARLARAREGGVVLELDGLIPELGEDRRLAWRPLAAADADAELVFLGLLPDARAAFAAVPGEGNADPAYTQRQIWTLLGLLGDGDLALYGAARSVLDWHARHRFCARCGQPTRLARAGWQRDCPEDSGGCGAQHFPRVDPVAIMLVECEGKLLLGRQARFPPRSYSALAGFVEPGETVEEAVAREVLEEAGVRVRDVRYVASQPWPFPSQLMIGCIGYADSLELRIDETEIEDARWFTRADVAEAMASGPDSSSFVAPTRQAIAHHLLQWWLENG
ncbi:MAG TPA: NAD(+) diphosphatase [Croceibacterium sp.]|nr:NAD(+) diphosphatase [Croceibacterium sp.]